MGLDRSERLALVASAGLMVLFLAALAYAAIGLDVKVPTCVADLAPFRQGRVIPKGEGKYEIHAVARMWGFDPAEVVLPVGSEVDIYLSTLDVVHGLYIEGTNVNLMAVPGVVNATRARFDEEGEYRVICHEYCGSAHHYMAGKVVVRSDAGALPIAPAAGAAPPLPATAAAAAGSALFDEQGCAACHSIDGSDGLGPTMKGLFGRVTLLADGTTVAADAAYVETAIRDPNAAVVKGYEALMPEVALTDDEVRRLVEYLRSLP